MRVDLATLGHKERHTNFTKANCAFMKKDIGAKKKEGFGIGMNSKDGRPSLVH